MEWHGEEGAGKVRGVRRATRKEVMKEGWNGEVGKGGKKNITRSMKGDLGKLTWKVETNTVRPRR